MLLQFFVHVQRVLPHTVRVQPQGFLDLDLTPHEGVLVRLLQSGFAPQDRITVQAFRVRLDRRLVQPHRLEIRPAESLRVLLELHADFLAVRPLRGREAVQGLDPEREAQHVIAVEPVLYGVRVQLGGAEHREVVGAEGNEIAGLLRGALDHRSSPQDAVTEVLSLLLLVLPPDQILGREHRSVRLVG